MIRQLIQSIFWSCKVVGARVLDGLWGVLWGPCGKIGSFCAELLGFKSIDGGLLRSRPDMTVSGEHRFRDVARQRHNGLFRHDRILRESRHEAMPEVVPTVV